MRQVVVVFAVGWLGFAVAPCQAMGRESAPDVPRHGSMPAGDCCHCPVETLNPGAACLTMAAADRPLPQAALADRRDAEHPDPQAALPPTAPNADAFLPVIRSPAAPGGWHSPASRVSIRQRYCTYLE
jgi:hypothetical protein